MTPEQFRTWATGKLTDQQIDALVKLLNKREMQKFVDEWTG